MNGSLSCFVVMICLAIHAPARSAEATERLSDVAAKATSAAAEQLATELEDAADLEAKAVFEAAAAKEAIDGAQAASPTDEAARGPARLSVAPIDHLQYPEDRPGWIEAGHDLESSTHRWIVRTEPSDSPEAAQDRLAVALSAGLETYVAQLLGSSDVAGILPADDKQVLEQLIARRYEGRLTRGGEPAYEAALELQITPEVRHRVHEAWKNRQVRSRLGALGVLVGGGLALLTFGAVVAGGISRHVERQDRRRVAA